MGASAVAPRRGARRETLAELARAVEAFVRDGLLGKAVARVSQGASLALGDAAFQALAALFDSDSRLPDAPSGVAPVTDELRESMVSTAAKLLRRWPSRASPGPNGSRFEHWGAISLDSESCEAAAHVVVMFALGGCSVEFLRANLGARILRLRKPSGKLRPVACGSVLRRLAARTLCAVLREELR